MDITTRFTAALGARHDRDPARLPDQLSSAAASSLGADGVGLSLAAERPALLGASDEPARVAEQLQFTAGSGPCLVAVDTQFPLFAVESYLQRRWPIYHDLLRTQTPFRSVVAFPLTGGLAGVGALVVYLRTPGGPLDVDSFDVHAVVGLVSAELTACPTWADRHQPALQQWLDTPGTRVRATAWQAVELISQVLATSTADALALLRARAYSSGRLVDEIACDVVAGRMAIADFA